jgi:NAD(P)-dependent dehydrogenase (short-subunit alcohol dehydrogenase family)
MSWTKFFAVQGSCSVLLIALQRWLQARYGGECPWTLAACYALGLFAWWRLVARPSAPLRVLKGEAVVVTGCDYGFGKHMALKLYAEGATVYAGCLSAASAEKLNAEAAAASKGNDAAGEMRGVVLDVTKDADVAACAEVVRQDGLPVRALVNNAGISAFGWAEMLPLNRYKRNMEVNYFGTVRMTQAFLPLLRASKGRVVNIGSIGARQPSAFGSAYLSTKVRLRERERERERERARAW